MAVASKAAAPSARYMSIPPSEQNRTLASRCGGTEADTAAAISPGAFCGSGSPSIGPERHQRVGDRKHPVGPVMVAPETRADAMSEYKSALEAARIRMAELRALRLAHEASKTES